MTVSNHNALEYNIINIQQQLMMTSKKSINKVFIHLFDKIGVRVAGGGIFNRNL